MTSSWEQCIGAISFSLSLLGRKVDMALHFTLHTDFDNLQKAKLYLIGYIDIFMSYKTLPRLLMAQVAKDGRVKFIQNQRVILSQERSKCDYKEWVCIKQFLYETVCPRIFDKPTISRVFNNNEILINRCVLLSDTTHSICNIPIHSHSRNIYVRINICPVEYAVWCMT